MKKSRVIIFILGVLILTANALASPNETNRVADRQTFFNDISDYFATIGKTENEKKEIIFKRRDERRKKRLENIENQMLLETQKRLGY